MKNLINVLIIAAMDKQISEHLDTFDSSDIRDFVDHYIAENDATKKSFDVCYSY